MTDIPKGEDPRLHPLWLRVVLRRFWARLRNLCRVWEMVTWYYESCDRCGCNYRIAGNWNDAVWVAVVGSPYGCFCPECFIQMAEEKGIAVSLDDVKLWYSKLKGGPND